MNDALPRSTGEYSRAPLPTDPLRTLFVHQNFPGQFGHLSRMLSQTAGSDVLALCDARRLKRQPEVTGVRRLGYSMPANTPALQNGHAFLRPFEQALLRGRTVEQAASRLRSTGFKPDLIVVHPGWGEGLFLRDAFPDARMVGYFEYYYRAAGSDVGFDPEFSRFDDNTPLRVRARNAQLLLSMESCDRGIAPTRWQQRQLPAAFQALTDVIHDGIDTRRIRPRPGAYVTLRKAGIRLTGADEVITFVSRNLEPYRGFHVFMRILPELLKRRPNAHVLIIGGDDVSYSPRPRQHPSYRVQMLAEVGKRLDFSRVHFVGRVPNSTYLDALAVSTAHVYLTYPFVLSWSCLEAMASGCLVVGSRTPPVEEVITDGVNGLLVDFFDQHALVEAIVRAVEDRQAMRDLRIAARQTIVDRYDLERVALPAQLALIQLVMKKSSPPSTVPGATLPNTTPAAPPAPSAS
ncbi:MAG: glycosyltransferase [Lautropia sp.]